MLSHTRNNHYACLSIPILCMDSNIPIYFTLRGEEESKIHITYYCCILHYVFLLHCISCTSRERPCWCVHSTLCVLNAVSSPPAGPFRHHGSTRNLVPHRVRSSHRTFRTMVAPTDADEFLSLAMQATHKDFITEPQHPKFSGHNRRPAGHKGNLSPNRWGPEGAVRGCPLFCWHTVVGFTVGCWLLGALVLAVSQGGSRFRWSSRFGWAGGGGEHPQQHLHTPMGTSTHNVKPSMPEGYATSSQSAPPFSPKQEGQPTTRDPPTDPGPTPYPEQFPRTPAHPCPSHKAQANTPPTRTMQTLRHCKHPFPQKVESARQPVKSRPPQADQTPRRQVYTTPTKQGNRYLPCPLPHLTHLWLPTYTLPQNHTARRYACEKQDEVREPQAPIGKSTPLSPPPPLPLADIFGFNPPPSVRTSALRPDLGVATKAQCRKEETA